MFACDKTLGCQGSGCLSGTDKVRKPVLFQCQFSPAFIPYLPCGYTDKRCQSRTVPDEVHRTVSGHPVCGWYCGAVYLRFSIHQKDIGVAYNANIMVKSVSV